MNFCDTYTATIYIAGDIAAIKHELTHAMKSGGCVSVVEADYVFTGGSEKGAAITLINYPRFPAGKLELDSKAGDIARHLLRKLAQRSCTIMTPDKTYFFENPEITTQR